MKTVVFSGLQFTGILLGILLFKVLLTRNKINKEAAIVLAYFNLVISITLLGRFLFSFYSLPQIIGYISDIIIFCFGPLIYFFVKSFIKRTSITIKIYHFIPAINHILAVIVLHSQNMLRPFNELNSFEANTVFSYGYYAEFIAISQILVYLLMSYRIIYNYLKKQKSEFSFNQLPSIFLLLLILIQIAICLWISGYISRVFNQHFIHMSYDLTWLILPLITLILTYSFLNKDPFFALSNKPSIELSDSLLQSVNQKLIYLLEHEKIYMQPKLSLADIAKTLNTNQSTLSKTINSIHKKNFFEFINDYRINEFVSRSKQDKYKSLTLIAIATDVGFHSKATFYSYFKKKFGTTPKNYLSKNNILN